MRLAPGKSPEGEILHLLLIAERGGCERDCWCLCKYWQDVRHTVLIVGAKGPMSEEFAAVGADVIHLDVLRRSRRERVRALRRWLGSTSAAAAIVWHGMPELPIIAHALSDWPGTIYVHGGNPAHTNFIQDLKYLAAERWWPSPHRPVYVCCSQYVAQSFERSFYLKRFRRVVVPNGVELPLEMDIHVPRPLVAEEKILVGMMARLDVMKNQETVIRALAIARDRSLPNLCLELLGDGPLRAKLEALAAELSLGPDSDAVCFLGNRSDIFSRMARWDLFLYATTPHEGFGNALAEAMMVGLPSIVTEVGPMREVGGEGAVIYVPPTDPKAMAQAIIDLVPDYDRRLTLGKRAMERAHREFSPITFAERYRAIIATGSKSIAP